MSSHPAIDAAVEQEEASIREHVDNSTAATLELQLLVGRDMARFVAQDCLLRVGSFPAGMDTTTRYQILLARLYAWQKTTSA